MSVIDMQSATKIASIRVGAALSHPEGVVVDSAGTRAYVALSNADQVAVVNLSTRRVRANDLGGQQLRTRARCPVALALDPSGTRLFVAESGADALAVIRLPGKGTPAKQEWTIVGRVPTAEEPEAVLTTAGARRPARTADLDRRPGRRHRADSRGPEPRGSQRPDLLGVSPDPPADGRHLQPGDQVRRDRAQGPGRADGASLRRADRQAHPGRRR